MRTRIGVAVGAPLAGGIELARAAERAGLALVTAGEGGAESFAVLGALAASTSRIGLVSAITNWTRTPVTTALGASTLAQLSGGRFRMTLGAMPKGWNERWHGIAYERPVDRMRDFVGALRAVWRAQPGGPTSHAGPFYAFRDYEPVVPLRPVPVSLAVTRPRMTELAGEIADGVNFNTVVPPAWIRDVLGPAVDRGLARTGRDRAGFDVGVLAIASVDDDRARSREVARHAIAGYFHAPYFADVLEHLGFERALAAGRAAAARGDREAAAAAVDDDLVDALALVGTADEVVAQTARYDGLADWVALVCAPGQLPPVVLGQIRQLLDAVHGG